MNILTSTFICILLFSCAGADLNSSVQSEDYSSSEEFADIPTAVAGAFLVCMKDESLAPDNVGCAMMTSEKKKSDNSDTIADEQRILAYDTKNERGFLFDKLEDNPKWSWSGTIDGKLDDFEFSFENIDSSNEDTQDKSAFMRSGEITIRIKNKAPYLSRSYLHYVSEGEKMNIKLGRKGLDKLATAYIPKGSTNIKLNVEVYTGLVWDKWRDIFRLELDDKKDVHCFRLEGTSLNTTYDEECTK